MFFHDMSFNLLGKDNEIYVTEVVINLIENTRVHVSHLPTTKDSVCCGSVYPPLRGGNSPQASISGNDFKLKFSKTAFILSF